MGYELIVLWAVAGLLGYYLYRCNGLRRGAGSELQDLLFEFTADIRGRAARGQDPDWLRYSEESDREHEYKCESFRNYATTALATGIGGTMFLLFMYLTTAPESGDAIQPLLEAMGLALVASGLGVVTNLGILIGILPTANKRFNRKRETFLEELRVICEQNPPGTQGPGSSDTVSERLEEILQNVAHNLPGVIEGFRGSVASLGEVATVFSASTEKMESATAVLSASVDELNALPENLGNQLTEARLLWANDIRENQERYLTEFRQVLVGQQEAVHETFSTLERWQGERAEADARWQERQMLEQNRHLEAVRGLVNATTDIAHAAERLPSGFREEIGRASETLGRAFGEQAQNHISDLIAATRRENKEQARTLDGHVGRMVNQTDDMVQRILNEMGGMVQEGLKPTLEGITTAGRNLEAAGVEVRRSIGEFADHGAAFKDSLDGAARQIDESSVQLAGVHEETRESIGKIQRGYGRLDEALNESADSIRSLLEDLSANDQQRRSGFLGWIGSLVKRDKGDGPVV